jgi:hypothetical protein
MQNKAQLCKDCPNLRHRKVGYVSSVFYCGLVRGFDSGTGLGVYPWKTGPHPKCPLRKQTARAEKEDGNA